MVNPEVTGTVFPVITHPIPYALLIMGLLILLREMGVLSSSLQTRGIFVTISTQTEVRKRRGDFQY